ncbi:MAG: hypothetical protein QOF43_988 [Gaiellaceae bacterium]|nr:hypothetical protein [Gaiellaceae bacterium]
MSYLLYSLTLETGTVPLHIKRGRGDRPCEASATCPTWRGAKPGRASLLARRMSSEGRKEIR